MPTRGSGGRPLRAARWRTEAATPGAPDSLPSAGGMCVDTPGGGWDRLEGSTSDTRPHPPRSKRATTRRSFLCVCLVENRTVDEPRRAVPKNAPPSPPRLTTTPLHPNASAPRAPHHPPPPPPGRPGGPRRGGCGMRVCRRRGAGRPGHRARGRSARGGDATGERECGGSGAGVRERRGAVAGRRNTPAANPFPSPHHHSNPRPPPSTPPPCPPSGHRLVTTPPGTSSTSRGMMAWEGGLRQACACLPRTRATVAPRSRCPR